MKIEYHLHTDVAEHIRREVLLCAKYEKTRTALQQTLWIPSVSVIHAAAL